MEIVITHFISRRTDMKYYSGSRAEFGEDAGEITWNNALDNVDPECPEADGPFISETEELDELRDYFADFGAWEEEDIQNWSPRKLNALLLQNIAGDIREAGDDLVNNYPEYVKRAEAGTISGRIFKDGSEYYYYVGS